MVTSTLVSSTLLVFKGKHYLAFTCGWGFYSCFLFLSPAVFTTVLQIMVGFWIHFEQIFHTCKHLIGSHSRICFPPSNHSHPTPPTHPIDACWHVAQLRPYFSLPQFHIYSCSHNRLGRGPHKFSWRGASLLPYSN